MNNMISTPYPVLWLRSLAFWIVFPISVVLFATLLLFTVPLPLTTRRTEDSATRKPCSGSSMPRINTTPARRP